MEEYCDISKQAYKAAKEIIELAGAVKGDLNVGGITGAMAIEYDFDPEEQSHPQDHARCREGGGKDASCLLEGCGLEGAMGVAERVCRSVACHVV